MNVIFDTDPGIDDAMALYLLGRHPSLRLRAVTSVFGNGPVDMTTHNARALLGLYGLAVPVARGAAGPLVPQGEQHFALHVHGDDGLGGMAAQAAPLAPLDPRPAHELICAMVNAEPGAITLIAVGPLTNLALALRHDPGIATKVRQVIVMGGAFGVNGHGGNVTPVAEANVICDPEAADVVFGAPWPVVIVGLDVTQEVVLTEEYLSRLQGRGQGAGDFLWGASRFYQRFYAERDGIRGIYAHDASAIVYAIEPDAFTLRPGPVRAVTEGIARGQTIQDHRDLGHGRPSAWSGLPIQQACVAVKPERVLAVFDAAFD